jgi:hypothetical protein
MATEGIRIRVTTTIGSTTLAEKLESLTVEEAMSLLTALFPDFTAEESLAALRKGYVLTEAASHHTARIRLTTVIRFERFESK